MQRTVALTNPMFLESEHLQGLQSEYLKALQTSDVSNRISNALQSSPSLLTLLKDSAHLCTAHPL